MPGATWLRRWIRGCARGLAGSAHHTDAPLLLTRSAGAGTGGIGCSLPVVVCPLTRTAAPTPAPGQLLDDVFALQSCREHERCLSLRCPSERGIGVPMHQCSLRRLRLRPPFPAAGTGALRATQRGPVARLFAKQVRRTPLGGFGAGSEQSASLLLLRSAAAASSRTACLTSAMANHRPVCVVRLVQSDAAMTTSSRTGFPSLRGGQRCKSGWV